MIKLLHRIMITIRQYKSEDYKKQVDIFPFFKIIACCIFMFIVFLSCMKSTLAQVRVTGHVFAEIVESTALSAKANNSHYIEITDITSNKEMLLAEVKFSGGMNMNIDVIVTSGNLKAACGEIIPFDAFASFGCTKDNPNTIDDKKLFTLKATPGESIRYKKNSTFKGRYSVVFMYN